jgi:hypothetical protein
VGVPAVLNDPEALCPATDMLTRQETAEMWQFFIDFIGKVRTERPLVQCAFFLHVKSPSPLLLRVRQLTHQLWWLPKLG